MVKKDKDEKPKKYRSAVENTRHRASSRGCMRDLEERNHLTQDSPPDCVDSVWFEPQKHSFMVRNFLSAYWGLKPYQVDLATETTRKHASANPYSRSRKIYSEIVGQTTPRDVPFYRQSTKLNLWFERPNRHFP